MAKEDFDSRKHRRRRKLSRIFRRGASRLRAIARDRPSDGEPVRGDPPSFVWSCRRNFLGDPHFANRLRGWGPGRPRGYLPPKATGLVPRIALFFGTLGPPPRGLIPAVGPKSSFGR